MYLFESFINNIPVQGPMPGDIQEIIVSHGGMAIQFEYLVPVLTLVLGP